MGVKKSRKITEGLPNEMIKEETVIILDFEGAQRSSIFSIYMTTLALLVFSSEPTIKLFSLSYSFV